MAYKCSFMDNSVYTAQDVNEVFSHLTSAGVVFSDTGNTLSDLNTVVSDTMSQGVANTDSCKVINQDGIYKISKGACFMADGSVIAFDDEGEELEITPGVYSYVYLKRNIPENAIDIVVSETAPEEDCVSLAEIDARGTVYDRRVYSRAKVQVGTPNTLKNFSRVISPQELITSLSVDVGTGDFSYFVIWDVRRTYGGIKEKYAIINQNLVPVSDSEGNFVDTGAMTGGAPDFTINISKDGQMLNLSFSRYNVTAVYEIEFGVI